MTRLESAERLKRLLSYLEQDPANLALLADAATAATDAGELAEAAKLLERSLSLAPERRDVCFKLATVCLALKNFVRARELFQLLVEEPPHPAVAYNLAYALWQLGSSDAAVATLVALAPEAAAQLPAYQLLLARCYYHAGRLEEALEQLDGYALGHSDDEEVPGLRALLLFDIGRIDDAVEAAQQRLGVAPDDLSAQLVLGSVAMERHHAVLARAHLNRVVALAPESGRAWSALAFTELLEMRLDAARTCFETAVQHMPDHLGTWNGLAWVHLMLGDRLQAREAVLKAMEVDHNFAENHGTLAVLSILDGHIDVAEREIKRGLRLDPQSPSTHYARSLLLSARGDAAGGKKLVDRILANANLGDGVEINRLLSRIRDSKPSPPDVAS